MNRTNAGQTGVWDARLPLSVTVLAFVLENEGLHGSGGHVMPLVWPSNHEKLTAKKDDHQR